MNFYIPTYEECVEINKKYGDTAFYEKTQHIDGFDISVWEYWMTSYETMLNPLDNHVNTFEMRGLTFIFKDDILIDRHLMMHKFFNINQTTETQYVTVLKKKIKSVYDKEDGSLISFLKLNDQVYARTKMYIYDHNLKSNNANDQSKMSHKIYQTDKNVKRVVDWALENNIILLWELVSPYNRVVLKYPNTELILLRARHNSTGEYISLAELDTDLTGVKLAINVKYSLDELLDLAQVLEDKEGWVVEFEDGQFIKVKCKQYCEIHGLITERIHREDYIISYIIDNKFDDWISLIPESHVDVRQRLFSIEKAVLKYISDEHDKINKEVERFYTYLDVKSYVLENIKNEHFYFVMKFINFKIDIKTKIIEDIKHKTYFLDNARKFLEKIM